MMAEAQTWRSELYPSSWTPPTTTTFSEKMIQDFSYAGYALGSPIPSQPAATIIDVTKAPYSASFDGSKDATHAIQQAIDTAGQQGGGTVYLPAGTYLLSVPPESEAALFLRYNNVTLKGAGPGKTLLLNNSTSMSKKDIIRVAGAQTGDWRTSTSESIPVTKDLLSPTRVIPVKDTRPFSPGDWIVIRSEPTNAFVREHRMGNHNEWHDQQEALRGVMFYRQIVGIDSEKSRLDIDIPIRYALKTRDDAKVHKSLLHRENVGIEDLSIGNIEHPATTGWGDYDYKKEGTPAHDVNRASAIHFWLAKNCWVKGVETFRPPTNKQDFHLLSNGIWIQYSRSITIKNCDFQRPQFRGGGGNGYMYQIRGQECLFQNCAARYCRHGFIFLEMQTSGNVIHGGTAEHSGYQSNGKGNDHHTHLSQSNLIDSIVLDHDFFECKYRDKGSTPIHGITGTQSVFWNLKGKEYYPKRPYIVHSQQYGWGYIIGTQGKASAIKTDGISPDKTAPVDWVEGEGNGATLTPTSLYIDQLKQRSTTPAPDVTLHTASAKISPGQDLEIILKTATPEDIQSCELYAGPISLGVFKRDRITWKNVPCGNHKVIACICTHNGLKTLSNPIEVQAEGVIAKYDFTPPSDNKTLSDSSGNSHHATTPSTLQYEQTKNGAAPQFNEPNDVIQLPLGIAGTASLSVDFWFRTGDSSSQGFLYYGAAVDGGNGYGKENELHLHMKKGGRMQLFIEGGENDISISSRGNFDDGKWHHAAITVGNRTACLYIDGQLEANVEYLAEPFTFSGCHQLGRPNAPDRNFRGAIDQLHIRNTVLSASDVTALARKGL